MHKNRLTNKQKFGLMVQYMCVITNNKQFVNLPAKKSTAQLVILRKTSDYDKRNENMLITVLLII